MFDQRHLDEGAKAPSLGPNYFRAREVVGKFMEGFEAEHFEPLLKKFSDEMYGKLLQSVEDYLLSNAEDNLQGELWRGTDEAVKALLSGESWAMERYALGERYDCEKVRAAVAKYIPTELQDKRIADLEKDNADLRKTLEYMRR
jgi:hypothetical protein